MVKRGRTTRSFVFKRGDCIDRLRLIKMHNYFDKMGFSVTDVSKMLASNLTLEILRWNVNIWECCLDMCHLSWWRHQKETFSALLVFCAGNSPVTGEFPAQRPVTRSFDVSLICVWNNSWVNNGDAGDLRSHRAHYGVTVMFIADLYDYNTAQYKKNIWYTTQSWEGGL